MALTGPQLAAAVWGTGYGSKKHLVDHANSRLAVGEGRRRHDEVQVRCSPTIFVDSLDSPGADPWGVLEARKPCARCQRIADADAANTPPAS